MDAENVRGTSRKRPIPEPDDVEVIPPSHNHASGTWAGKNNGHPRKVRKGEHNPIRSSRAQVISDIDPRKVRKGVHNPRHHDSRNRVDWVSKAQSFVAQNPYTSATIGAAAGGLAITTGGALTAVGLSITTLGGTVMCGSAVIGLLATLGSMVGPKRNPKTAYAGACLAIVGGLLGAAISVTGALVSALGAALGVAGTVIIGVSSLVAVAKSAQLCWEHRQKIQQLLACIRAKLPGATRVEIHLSPAQMTGGQTLDLSKPMKRARTRS